MPELNLLEAARQVAAFKDYFVNPEAYLDEGAAPEEMDLKFSSGPTFLRLPEYLGAAMIGRDEIGLEISAYEVTAHLLNEVKRTLQNARKVTAGDLLRLIDFEARVEAAELTVAGLTASGTYLLTTPAELAGLPDPRLAELGVGGLTRDDIEYVLTPGEGAEADEDGICILFGGGLEITAGLSFKSIFGLTAHEGHFGTGFRSRGLLAAGAVDAAMEGRFQVDPGATLPVRLDGHAHFALLDETIFSATVSLGEEGFHFDGLLDLFPNGGPVQLKGTVVGDLAPGTVSFEGEVEFVIGIGPGVTVAGSSVSLTDTHFRVSGTFLDQTATFTVEQHEVDDVTGVRLSAALTPIRLGSVFALTGEGPDGGALASLTVLPGQRDELSLTGTVELVGIAASTRISLTDRGFEFDVEGRFLDLFAARVDVLAASFDDARRLALTVTLAGSAVEEVASALIERLTGTAEAAKDAIARAEQRVGDRQADLDGVKRDANSAVDAARQREHAARAEISSIDSELKKTPARKAKRITELKSARTRAKARHRQAEADLEVARAVKELVDKGAAIAPVLLGKLTPALTRIRDRAEKARMGLDTAASELRRVREELGHHAKLIDLEEDPLVVGQIRFRASLDAVDTDAEVDLSVKATFLGRTETHRLRCKLGPPRDLAEALAKKFLALQSIA
jgi:hypothetical protein